MIVLLLVTCSCNEPNFGRHPIIINHWAIYNNEYFSSNDRIVEYFNDTIFYINGTMSNSYKNGIFKNITYIQNNIFWKEFNRKYSNNLMFFQNSKYLNNFNDSLEKYYEDNLHYVGYIPYTQYELSGIPRDTLYIYSLQHSPSNTESYFIFYSLKYGITKISDNYRFRKLGVTTINFNERKYLDLKFIPIRDINKKIQGTNFVHLQIKE